MEKFATSTAYHIEFEQLSLDQQTYFVPRYANHRPACQAFLKGRYFEPMTHALIGDLLSQWPGDLIHAGTFFGDMLPSFSAKCPGTVYAFEPVLENYVLARLCLQANALRNVALFHSALGRSIAISSVSTHDPSGVHSGGGFRVTAEGQIGTTMTIDCLALQRLSVVELDVEGSELAALTGAKETIARNRPVVLIEDYAATCDGLLLEERYSRIGEVPGLIVWAPAEKAATTERLLAQVDIES